MLRTLLFLLFLLPLGARAAQEYPKLKPGLWEMTTTSGRSKDRPPQKSSICLDASLQQDMVRMSAGMMQGMCSKFETKYVGNTFSGEATCKLGDSTMKSKSVMTMTGDTAYRTEAHASFDPPMAGMTQSDTVIEGRHIGACKPGQQPGDMTTPNGQTMNIRNIMSGNIMGGKK
ncbi:MAG TPA: DUF3617 family protein [Casimicrobiaceae bacterium]